MRNHNAGILTLTIFLIIIFFHLTSANTYVADISFTLSNPVYTTNEQIGLLGYISLANYTDSGTLVSSLSSLENANINLTLKSTANVFCK